MTIATELREHMSSVARLLRCRFTVKNQPVSLDQVFSETGLFPAFVKRADQLSSFCLGYGLGVVFEETQSSTVGVKVKFDESTPNALRLLCLTDVLIELMHQGASSGETPLDELLYD